MRAAVHKGEIMAQIELSHVSKEYLVAKKEKALRGVVRNLFFAEKRKISAVRDISFSIERGEIVGYIGPNGAGKSTTLKMMCGIMMPTGGEIRVNGISPQQERKKVVQNLGVVFGQRTQLYWDLRLGETFELLKRIYRVPDDKYRERLGELVKILEMDGFLDIPVRQLSLGQRMRGEMAAAMLHSPEILFLDEPTIGLDIDAKKAVRQFILDINRRMGVTVILTSHDLEDVYRLCSRMIVINYGTIVRDGPMEEIIRDMADYRVMKLVVSEGKAQLETKKVTLVSVNGERMVCHFNHHRYTASEVIKELSEELSIVDLSVEEPDIEDAVSRLYHI